MKKKKQRAGMGQYVGEKREQVENTPLGQRDNYGSRNRNGFRNWSGVRN